jgi:hypothetical protein
MKLRISVLGSQRAWNKIDVGFEYLAAGLALLEKTSVQ